MPKKTKINGYWYFRMEFQRERGIRDNDEAQRLADEQWRSLSEGQRQRYKELAKQEEVRISTAPRTTYNNLGRNVQELEREQSEEIRTKLSTEEAVNDFAKRVMNIKDPAHYRDFPFYLMHVNYFCEVNKTFIPAEIAITEATIGEADRRTLHYFVNPGNLPIGYGHEAQQQADRTHKILITDVKDMGCDRPDVLFREIFDFITNGNEVQPVFTMYDDRHQNTSLKAVTFVLDQLWQNHHHLLGPRFRCATESCFKVYPLSDLLYYMLLHISDQFQNATIKLPDATIAGAQLNKDWHVHERGIRCDFHEKVDSTECSKVKVVKWARIIQDFCLKHVNQGIANIEDRKKELVAEKNGGPRQPQIQRGFANQDGGRGRANAAAAVEADGFENPGRRRHRRGRGRGIGLLPNRYDLHEMEDNLPY